jgi:hypothetical protein
VFLARAQTARLKHQIIGDLISYQNDGKCDVFIVGNVERA